MNEMRNFLDIASKALNEDITEALDKEILTEGMRQGVKDFYDTVEIAAGESKILIKYLEDNPKVDSALSKHALAIQKIMKKAGI